MQNLRQAFIRNPLVWFMAFTLLAITSIPREAVAALIPSQLAGEQTRFADMEKLQTFLESKLVSQRLTDLGFSPSEVKAKVENFSNEDLHYLAGNLDQLSGGGDGLGIIISLLVIALLVIIIMQVSGRRIIITK